MILFNFDYEVRPPKPPVAEPVAKPKPLPTAENLARTSRILCRVLVAVSLAPWLNLAVWTAYAWSARFALGHYPHYMIESVPPSVDNLFGLLTAGSMLLLVLSLPVWFGLTLCRIVRWNDTRAWRTTVVYLLGWATTILVCTIDPVGFVNWFLD